ncbi:MAG: hypothetical protein ACYSWR_07175 [Planctomycetota bacterium]
MGKRQDLTDAILERAQESQGRMRLTCADAFELAREFKTEVIQIGHICNRHNIKISKCQLGCFA